MIYQLLKRDPAWRLARYMMAAFTAASLFSSSHGVSAALLPLAFFNVGLLQSGDLLVRTGLFYAALPVSGRQIFRARAIACLTLAAGPLGAAAAAYGITHPADLHTVLDLLAIGAAVAFFTLCTISLRIREFAPPARLKAVLPWASVLAMPVIFWPRAAALPLLAASAIGCAIRWVTIVPQVPECFQTAPLEAAEPGTRPQRAVPAASPSAWWAIVRASVPWQGWMMAPFLALTIFVHPIIMLFGFGIPSAIRERIRWLLALPVSPRALLALMMAPYLLPLIGGYAIFAHFGRERSLYPRFASIVSGKATVDVPLEYWRRAPAGVAPVAQAPWGETFQPPVHSMMGFAAYNPYAAGPSNSDRFQYWQFSRAAAVIYGEPLTFEQVEAGRRAGALIPVILWSRGQILSTALLLAVAILIQWPFGLPYWRRLPLPPVRQFVHAGLLLAFFSALALNFWMSVKGMGFLGLSLFNSLILHLLRWMPDRLIVTLAAAALMVAIPYYLLERQFRQSEIAGAARPTGPFGQALA